MVAKWWTLNIGQLQWKCLILTSLYSLYLFVSIIPLVTDNKFKITLRLYVLKSF